MVTPSRAPPSNFVSASWFSSRTPGINTCFEGDEKSCTKKSTKKNSREARARALRAIIDNFIRRPAFKVCLIIFVVGGLGGGFLQYPGWLSARRLSASTPTGDHQPSPFQRKRKLVLRAKWELKDRPRRIALLLDDCQEEYRPLAGSIIPNLEKLTNAFRFKQASITWSVWNRSFDDGISNSVDRWYGNRFAYASDKRVFKEIAPTATEQEAGALFPSMHFDMFWNFDENGKSFLDERLKALGIDTIVIAGLWTDECISATAFAGYSRGYDVVVVGDAVQTGTDLHETALKVLTGSMAKVVETEDVARYLMEDYVEGEIGQVKGTKHPDGRKDGNVYRDPAILVRHHSSKSDDGKKRLRKQQRP